MQVIAIRYVTYSRTLCGRKKAFGDRIQRRVELLGGRGRKDGLSAGSDHRGVEQELESVIETVVWMPCRISRLSNEKIDVLKEKKFGNQGKSPSRQTAKGVSVAAFGFDYCVESAGRQTKKWRIRVSLGFDYRVESAGRQTDAGEPTDQMPDRTSEPDDKTSVFLFQRPRTGFPVRCGSPQALIPAPTAVQFALARRTYVTQSVAYAGNSNPLCHV